MTPEIVRPLALTNGFFYIGEFSATGGVSYSRTAGYEHEEGDRLTSEFTTRKDVAHVGLLKWSRKIINAAYCVMEKHASQTPIGYWVTLEAVEGLQRALEAVMEEADAFNRAAVLQGCQRRVRISVYSVRAAEDDQTVAIRLAQTVRERLEELVTDLRSGDLNAFITSWKKAKNLPRLATGIQSESIVLGLEAAKEAKALLAQYVREGATSQEAGAKLDLMALESAICLFTDSVNGTLWSEEIAA